MKKILISCINIGFFFAIFILAIIVTTIAFTKRVNEQQAQYDGKLSGSVIKDTIPVMALTTGVVAKINVRIGEKVQKNQLLIQLTNPVLEGKIHALENYPDNVSAQTEASVAEEELKQLQIYAPVDGVVTDILTSEGSPVEPLVNLIKLYSDDHILLLTHLTNDQYQEIQHMQEIDAYSARLNQDFVIVPDILQPEESMDQITYQKEIGLYFSFKDKTEAQSLLNNEDLQLNLKSSGQKIMKPADYIVAFWNNILSNKKPNAY